MTRLASSNRSRSVRTSLPLCALLLALATTGCNCAVGEPTTHGDANVPPVDMGTDSYVPPVDMGTDSYVPPVDMGMMDAGGNTTCGDGYIAGTELGEVCDPAAVGVIPELMCQCPDDGNLCTNDIWVPDPVLGVCYGSCQHPTRTDFMATTCGLGVCASTGNTFCSNNMIMDSCMPGQPTGADTDCNGVDEDCDGTPDDGFVPTGTTCGMGACASTGTTTCVGGVQGNTCVAGSPSALDNNCNGLDENCNGTPDDGYQPVQTSCGLGVCAANGASSCSNGMLADSCVPNAPTAATDITCDNLDDDCNGQKDEDYVGVATNCGVGQCARTGMTVCNHPSATIAIESNTCTPGTPSGEICDGLDNDCNGMSDDGAVLGVGVACSTGLFGACAAGTRQCSGGSLVCTPSAMPTIEVCDGIDNDCNNMVDDIAAAGCVSPFSGVCAAGVRMCQGNVAVCVANIQPNTMPEVCDGLDNDCDGVVNDGNPGGGGVCGTGLSGVCNAGVYFCDNTVTTLTCRGNIAPGTQQEICDGKDNDCDGRLDIDAYAPEAPPIGNSCATANLRTISVGVGASQTVTGTVDPSGDDYITVNFTGVYQNPARYHPLITLSNNGGGKYVIQVLDNLCAATSCGGDVQTFEALYNADQLGCASNSMVSKCTDNVARVTTYIVRVHRVTASPTDCTGYTLTVSNI